MKKITQDQLIEILKNKDIETFKELAKITGYHEKSLIRLNSTLKKNNYKMPNKKNYDKDIIKSYLDSKYITYKDYYKFNCSYNVSYSYICKLLNNTKTNEEILIIKKIKEKGNYYFEIIDYENEALLFKTPSLKNDSKTFKTILLKVLENYGAPNNILFINFFKDIPKEINNLLKKYYINIKSPKSLYTRTKSNKIKIKPTYKNIDINNSDFYNKTIRKTIDINTIQFKNIRYQIITTNKIKKNESLILYYDNNFSDLSVEYNNCIYKLEIIKTVTSKKGNTKYN